MTTEWSCDERHCYDAHGVKHCRHELGPRGEIICKSGQHATYEPLTPLPVAHRRSVGKKIGGDATPNLRRTDDAAVSAVLTKLRTTAATVAASAPSTATRAPRRLRVVAGTAPRGASDAAREIAHKLTDIATGSRMREWSRQLDDLAAEIEGHAAADDLATLRRLRDRFATVGARLLGAA